MIGEAPHPTALARLLFGGWLVVFPRSILAALGAASDRRAILLARILGARHLAEAVLVGFRSDRRLALAGALVDGTHAITAAGFGALDRTRRRAALTNAVVAAGFCVGGLLHARKLAEGGERTATIE